MIKVTIVFTHYNFDKDEGTAHAFVQLKNKIEIHGFNFKYQYDEDTASDDEDIRNITDVLKKHYGNDLEIELKRVHKYHDIDYNK